MQPQGDGDRDRHGDGPDDREQRSPAGSAERDRYFPAAHRRRAVAVRPACQPHDSDVGDHQRRPETTGGSLRVPELQSPLVILRRGSTHQGRCHSDCRVGRRVRRNSWRSPGTEQTYRFSFRETPVHSMSAVLVTCPFAASPRTTTEHLASTVLELITIQPTRHRGPIHRPSSPR